MSSPEFVIAPARAASWSTTRWLAQRLQAPVSARLLVQAERPAAAVLPGRQRRQLPEVTSPEQVVILRRSQLVHPDGYPVSANKVILFPEHPLAAAITDGGSRPLGTTLARWNIVDEREMRGQGTRRWWWEWGSPAGLRTSPARTYLIRVDGQLLCWIREIFHPDVVPDLAAVPGSDWHSLG